MPQRTTTARRYRALLALIGLATCAPLVAHQPLETLAHPGYRPVSAGATEFATATASVTEPATIAVHPTIIRRARRTAHALESRARVIAALESAGLSVVAGNERIEFGPLVGEGSQWAVFQSDLSRIAEAVRGAQPEARYHLLLEFLLPVTDDEIFGIECYVVDQQGDNVFSFLLNAHHKAFAEGGLATTDSSEASRTRMLERATDVAVAALLAQLEIERGHAARDAARREAIAAGRFEEALFDTFEAVEPAVTDHDGIALGFAAFTDDTSTASFSTTTDHPPRPGAPPGNHVLRLDLDVDGWAGFSHFFAYRDGETAYWMPYDWRAFDGIAFWLYGRNSGVTFFVDVVDNRNRQSRSDDAERFVYTFRDDFTGWRRLSIPFTDFVRKEIGNGAPDDGLGLSSVHGWAIGTQQTDGPVTYFVDDVALQHVMTTPHAHDDFGGQETLPINQLPMYGMRDKTPDQQRADAAYIELMTRGGRTREDAAEIAAKNAWNTFYAGRKTIAIKRFNQAWLLDPDNRLALWGFAVTSVDRGDFEAAARYFRMAIERGPEDPALQRDYELTLRQIEKTRITRRPGDPQ